MSMHMDSTCVYQHTTSTTTTTTTYVPTTIMTQSPTSTSDDTTTSTTEIKQHSIYINQLHSSLSLKHPSKAIKFWSIGHKPNTHKTPQLSP